MIKNTDFKLEEIYSPDNANVIYFAYKNKLESIVLMKLWKCTNLKKIKQSIV
jgi:hypothetical protein